MNIVFVYRHHTARVMAMQQLMRSSAGFMLRMPDYVLHKGDLNIRLMLESDMPQRAAGTELSMVLVNPVFGSPTPEWQCHLREGTDLDGERYRLLRSMSWFDSPLAVVADPKKAVKLGHDCPSGVQLDDMLDALLRKR